jgi:UDP-glucose 4-epimerase
VKILVTGGSGFIGSHVVDRLRLRGHDVTNLDLVHSEHHDGDVRTVRGDVLDRGAVRAAVRGCDAVFHLAAVSDVERVVADPSRAEQVNVRGTKILLDAARSARVERFVYASTVWVYGGSPAQQPLEEDAPLVLPSHFYTATKLAGEMYCRAYGELFGLANTILRFGIPYGPRSRPTPVVAAFVDRALRGKPLTIAGDGAQSRRFVYVEDLAEGVVAALAPGAAGRIYNLVGEESTSIRAIADTVRDLVADVPVVHVAGRAGDLPTIEISGRRAATELGWRATTPFVEGVRRYIAWLTETNGRPAAEPASRTNGRAAAVLRQEPGEL